MEPSKPETLSKVSSGWGLDRVRGSEYGLANPRPRLELVEAPPEAGRLECPYPPLIEEEYVFKLPEPPMA